MTPRPPAIVTAPFVLEVATVVSVTVRLSTSAPSKFTVLPYIAPVTPRPPLTIRAPFPLAEEAVPLVTFVIPSNSAVEPNKAPVIPVPPAT